MKILQWAITGTLETKERLGNLSKEIKDVKKNQIQVLELKNTMTEIKNSMDGLKKL